MNIKSGAWSLLQQKRSWLKDLQRRIRIFRYNEGINAPWILVVEAKCNLIDSVGVGHDQVEAILIVHDGSETKDADMDVILLAHQAGVLQGPAARESTVPRTDRWAESGRERTDQRQANRQRARELSRSTD